MTAALMFVAAAAAGAVVGVFSGLLGIGGGSMTLPLFRLIFGLSAVGSTATSLFTIIPTSISGAISHIRGKTCIPKLGLALGIGGAITSPVGVWLAQMSPSWAIMFAAALAVGYSSFTMLQKALKAPTRQDANRDSSANAGRSSADAGDSGSPVASDSSSRPVVSESPGSSNDVGGPGGSGVDSVAINDDSGDVHPNFSRTDLAKAAFIGAVTGVASGFIGLGGGFLMVPMMLSLLRMPMKLASGTSLIAVMLLAMPATIMQCMLGNVDYLAGIALACGSVPGAYFGARLTKRAPERALRFGFAAFLGFAAIMLVVKELGVLG